MGIYLPNMEMPKTCKQCLFSRYILGEWFCRTTTTLDEEGEELWESVGKFGNLHRPRWCPLVPVPPHGDLIDRSRMKESIRMQTGFLKAIGGDLAEAAEILEKGFLQEIDNAPTVIEAEEG